MSNDARQKEFKMRTIEKQIYVYAELSQKAQEKALANYNESEDYVQDTYSQVDILAMLGFIETKVHCSGFYSQGDGSCFEGVWYPENMDIDKIKTEYPQWTELHSIADHFNAIKTEYTKAYRAKVIQCGRYYHENAMTLVEFIDDENEDIDYDSSFMDTCKSLARLFHKQFEEDYEYRTSEIAFQEHCANNEREFYEDGSSY
jgi:hypothetical protein